MLHSIKTFLKNNCLALLLLLVMFVILNARTLQSITRFPADPGYDYLFFGATDGVQSWFDLDPYVHFGAHFISWLASFSPLKSQSIVLATLVHFVWSVLGVFIFIVLRRDGFSKSVSLLSALSLALCPAASESSLANVGNIKWPLLIFALILVSSNQLKRSPKISCAYLFITGITNPLSVIIFLPLLMNFFSSNKIDRKLFVLPIVGLLVSFVIQAVTVGSSGLGHGRGGAKVLEPWQGMGLFWWSGLISPSLICVVALILQSLFHLHSKSHLIIRVAFVVPALALGSYLYGGIADRYFVAPMVISWIVSIVFINDIAARLNRNYVFVVSGLAFLLFLVPTIKWFNSGWYLNAGPTWSDEVELAKAICSDGGASVHLNIGEISTIELSCSYIRNK